jgi:hypothetical protein
LAHGGHYPSAVSTHLPTTANVGVRIHYAVEESGPPLVLHPGFVQSIQDWYDADYVGALFDRGRDGPAA